MIIRSQNKTRIMDDLNLHIGIHEYKETDNTFEIRDTSNVTIGEYSTMEKAVKVLDAIQDTYVRSTVYNCLMNGTAAAIVGCGDAVAKQAFETGRDVFVFQMPQDSEV